jgi:hypothetical protein
MTLLLMYRRRCYSLLRTAVLNLDPSRQVQQLESPEVVDLGVAEGP